MALGLLFLWGRRHKHVHRRDQNKRCAATSSHDYLHAGFEGLLQNVSACLKSQTISFHLDDAEYRMDWYSQEVASTSGLRSGHLIQPYNDLRIPNKIAYVKHGIDFALFIIQESKMLIGVIKTKDILRHPFTIISMKGFGGFFKLLFKALSRKPHLFINSIVENTDWLTVEKKS